MDTSRTVLRLVRALRQPSLVAALCACPIAAQTDPFHASTFFGGSFDNPVFAVTRAPNGDVVVVGSTRSSNLPTTPGAFQPSQQGNADGFVARLSPDLTQLLAATYLGGAELDRAQAVTVAPDGSIWVAGMSEGAGFPTTTNAYSTVADTSRGNAFFTRLDASLSTVLYSSYFGEASTSSTGRQEAFEILFDDSENTLYLAGETLRPVPLTAGAVASSPGGVGLFLAVFDLQNPLTTTLSYATHVAGSGFECDLGGLDVDAQGVVTVSGITTSTDLPTTPNAIQPTRPGPESGFVMQIDTTPGAMQPLRYSTYLGGSAEDATIRHAVDPTGRIHVALGTSSVDVPVSPNAALTTGDGSDDAYEAQLDPTASGAASLVYGSYAFTQGSVELKGLGQAGGRVATLWRTSGFGFPTTVGAFMRRDTGLPRGYLRLIDVPTGSAPTPVYASYYGGRAVEVAALHFDGTSVTIGGRASTDATGVPITPGVVQPTPPGGGGFVGRFDVAPWPDPVTTFGTGCAGTGGNVELRVTSGAVLGTNFRLEADQLGAFTDGVLLLQLSPVVAGTTPISPLPLDILGAPGCALRVDPLLTLPASRQSTPQVIQIAIPADPILLSLRIFAQYLDLDAGANAFGLTTSNGVSCQVRW